MSQDWDNLLFKLSLAEALEEVATSITEEAWLYNEYAFYISFDYIHWFNLCSFKKEFLKSSRPSLLIKRAALGNLKASFHCTHWHRFFPLKEAPPLISVFSPQGRRGKPPYSVLEPLRYKVGGPSKVSPGYAGWDRQGWKGDL